VNPELPIADVRTVKEIYGKSMARTSFTLVMLALAGTMALLLGVIGIYGVISYSVSRRTREIGIRIALGASQGTVRQMFLKDGRNSMMSTLLFEVSPLDPITYGAVSVVLVAAALLAVYFPTRRATTIEPMEALRAE
jgi:putative ABC transport system permease protein